MRPVIILFTAFLTFSGGAFAFSMAGIIKQAEVIKVNAVTAATNTAITVSTTIRGFAANDPYQIKSIDVPKTRYMGFVKGNLGSLVKKNAWYAGWFATMAAAGWAIDELTGQVVSTEGVAFNYAGNCSVWTNSTGTVYVDIGLTESSADCISKVKAHKYYYSYWNSDVIPFTSAVNTFNKNPIYGQGYVIYISPIPVTNAPFTGTYYAAFRPNNDNPPVAQTSPVPDDAIYDSLAAEMTEDPVSAAQAFMVPDPWPYPYPEIFPDTVPYIPGVTQSDQELLDLYAQGLLQSTNPNAAHYVTPEKYAEIAALAGQLQAGATPEALVDAANEAAQAPLTQAQLEETLRKQEAAAAKADAAAVTQAASALAPAATALDKLNDEKADLEGMITDSPTAQPPSTMPNIFKWTLPTGNCQPFPFTFTIQAGSAHADDNGAFCQTYNEVAHPLIFWFLNMLTAVYIFGIWSRTMTSVVGGR